MNGKTKLLTYSALMCALMVLSTLWFKFTLPGTDMLVTTQVFFVLLCGQLLPPRYCVYSIGAYIMLGLIGLPVFSATVGPAVAVTPSFGYLLGFPVGAACCALLCRRSSALKYRLLAAFAGLIATYAIALPYIAALKALYMKTPIGFGTLMGAYCAVFLPPDIIKAVLAALLGGRLSKALGLNMANVAPRRGEQA